MLRGNTVETRPDRGPASLYNTDDTSLLLVARDNEAIKYYYYKEIDGQTLIIILTGRKFLALYFQAKNRTTMPLSVAVAN